MQSPEQKSVDKVSYSYISCDASRKGFCWKADATCACKTIGFQILNPSGMRLDKFLFATKCFVPADMKYLFIFTVHCTCTMYASVFGYGLKISRLQGYHV